MQKHPIFFSMIGKEIPGTKGLYVMFPDKTVLSVRYNRILSPTNGKLIARIRRKATHINVNHTYGKLFVQNPNPYTLTEFDGNKWVKSHGSPGRPFGSKNKRAEKITTDGWRKLLYPQTA